MSGFLVLLRHRLRRDWVQLILWLVGIPLLAYAAVGTSADTFGEESERRQILAVAVATRTILVFRGTPNGTDEGAFAFFLIWAWLALMSGLMNVFLAVRHTRAEEEQGRAELVASTPAGRQTPTAATLVHGVLVNLVLGLLLALAMQGAGLAAEGSFVAGLAITVTGLAFLAIGLVLAQLFRTPRGANSAGVAIVLAAYLLRGIGDAAGTPSADLVTVTPAWPTWLSPIGYGQLTGAYVQNDLVPLLVPLGLAVALVVLVFALQSVRDQGASLLPERGGRATAGPVLSSSLGLVARLSRPILLAWAAGGIATGLLSTSLSGAISQLADTTPEIVERLQQALGGSATLEQAFLATFFGLVGVLAACCAVQVGIRARQEEMHGTAEVVLATPVRKVRWLLDYWIAGVVVVAVVLSVAALAAVAGATTSSDPDELIATTLEAAVAQLPAALLLLGVTLALVAWLPRLTIPLAWTIVGIAAIVGVFGPILQAPQWILDLSPFTHSPVPGGDDADWVDGYWMLAIAVVTAGAAVVSMRRREFASGG
jgi:ABC-2 type transport system permease protein